MYVHRFKKISGSLKLLSALLIGLGAAPVWGLAQTQDDVTVAFLYNFARFVEWPAGSFANGNAPFTIGFVGKPALAEKFTQAVQGKNVGGREFNVRKLEDLSAAAACQIVFIGDQGKVAALVAGAKGKPVLCVGEGADFLAAGGMIAFNREGARLVFDVNPAAITAVQLTPGEKLLKAARSVKGGG
jgi:YfiR/HmsC-like